MVGNLNLSDVCDVHNIADFQNKGNNASDSLTILLLKFGCLFNFLHLCFCYLHLGQICLILHFKCLCVLSHFLFLSLLVWESQCWRGGKGLEKLIWITICCIIIKSNPVPVRIVQISLFKCICIYMCILVIEGFFFLFLWNLSGAFQKFLIWL